MDITVVSAFVLLGLMGLLFGAILAFIAKKFAVTVDERVSQVLEALPGINCGACGYPGCSGFAKSVVDGKAPVSGCIPGGKAVADNIAQILGKEVGENVAMVAVARCGGGCQNAVDKYEYKGLMDCRAAYILGGGPKQCDYGCTGLGTCVEACPFRALTLGENRIPLTDFDKCTGCGICVRICPNNVMMLIPADQMVYVACNSPDKAAATKKACAVGCIGCQLCLKSCPKEAIRINGFLAEVIDENCIGCGVCILKCPTNAIVDRGTGIPLPEPEKMTRRRLKKEAEGKKDKKSPDETTLIETSNGSNQPESQPENEN
ncbi:RnfABCDGE type electron transport complex subunit B [bacterium]|nr:RnfABCDGE type electron transport complex subunit B [bacterium]